jgi:N-acetylgalactosamine PTS system EIIA component
MIGIIISGHGAFASGLYSSIKVIAGEHDQVVTCDFLEGMSTEQLTEAMEAGIKALGVDDIVFFTDLKGGTPFKVAATLAINHPQWEVVAGTNLPMLLESVMIRNFMNDALTLADKAVKTGQDQVYRFVMETKTVVAVEEGI